MYRCTDARKNSAKPVTTCQNQSVVSSCCIMLHVVAEGRELAVVDRELAHREHRVRDEQRDDRRRRRSRRSTGYDRAEEEVALEEPGDRPHRVLAEQDRRDEEHVAPHEQRRAASPLALCASRAAPASGSCERAGIAGRRAGDDGRTGVHGRSGVRGRSTAHLRQRPGRVALDTDQRTPPGHPYKRRDGQPLRVQSPQVRGREIGPCKAQAPVGRTPAPLAPWFPRGVDAAARPGLNKGTAFTEAERDALGLRGLLPPHVCTPGGAGRRACSRTSAACTTPLEKYIFLTALHDRNEALFFRVVIENLDEMHADHLHADGGPGLPEVRPHLPAAARHLRHRQRPRPGQRAAAQLAASRRRDDRRHRRRAHPRPRRSRRQRHGHPGRQALALHRLRRRPPDAVPAGDARRRHQQRGAARRPALPRPAPAAPDRRRLRRAGRRVRHRGRARSFPAW